METVKEDYLDDDTYNLSLKDSITPNNLIKNNSFRSAINYSMFQNNIKTHNNQMHLKAKSSDLMNDILYSDNNTDELQIIEPNIYYKKINNFSTILPIRKNKISNIINNNLIYNNKNMCEYNSFTQKYRKTPINTGCNKNYIKYNLSKSCIINCEYNRGNSKSIKNENKINENYKTIPYSKGVSFERTKSKKIHKYKLNKTANNYYIGSNKEYKNNIMFPYYSSENSI